MEKIKLGLNNDESLSNKRNIRLAGPVSSASTGYDLHDVEEITILMWLFDDAEYFEKSHAIDGLKQLGRRDAAIKLCHKMIRNPRINVDDTCSFAMHLGILGQSLAAIKAYQKVLNHPEATPFYIDEAKSNIKELEALMAEQACGSHVAEE